MKKKLSIVLKHVAVLKDEEKQMIDRLVELEDLIRIGEDDEN